MDFSLRHVTQEAKNLARHPGMFCPVRRRRQIRETSQGVVLFQNRAEGRGAETHRPGLIDVDASSPKTQLNITLESYQAVPCAAASGSLMAG